MNSSIHIRRFTEADIPFGMRLKEAAGWNQTEADWRRFLALHPEGCFVAELDGEPAGAATTTPYGRRFAWVGMVLVDPAKRRRGVGTALLRHCLAHLGALGVKCVKLDATPQGKKLYDTLGFVDEFHIERLQIASAPAPDAGERAEPLAADDLPAVAEYDAALFGAPRLEALRLLWEQHPPGAFVRRAAGHGVAGYLFVRPGARAWQIGPWAADDEAAARALLRAGLRVAAGAPAFIDIPLTHPEPKRLLAALGFETQRPLIRMFRGANRFPGDTRRVYSFCGPETG